MEKLLEFLVGLLKVLFGRDSESPSPETPREPPVEKTVTGWEGDPPYRYIDVSRYQGRSTGRRWQRQATRERCSRR